MLFAQFLSSLCADGPCSQVFARIQEAQDEAAANKGQKRGRAPEVENQKGKKQSFKL